MRKIVIGLVMVCLAGCVEDGEPILTGAPVVDAPVEFPTTDPGPVVEGSEDVVDDLIVNDGDMLDAITIKPNRDHYYYIPPSSALWTYAAKWNDELAFDIFVDYPKSGASTVRYYIDPSLYGIANATTTLDINSPYPYDCVIKFASSKFLTTDTVQHELGHCIGLGHSDDKYSIMYPMRLSGITRMVGPELVCLVYRNFKDTSVCAVVDAAN